MLEGNEDELHAIIMSHFMCSSAIPQCSVSIKQNILRDLPLLLAIFAALNKRHLPDLQRQYWNGRSNTIVAERGHSILTVHGSIKVADRGLRNQMD